MKNSYRYWKKHEGTEKGGKNEQNGYGNDPRNKHGVILFKQRTI